MNAEEPEINNLNGKSSYMFKGKAKPRTFENKKPWYEDKQKKEQSKELRYDMKKLDCWHCGKTGHVKAKCYRYLKSKGENIASPREPATHGINV